MTGLRLFLKSRRMVGLLATLTAAAVAGRLVGGHGTLLGDRAPFFLPWVVLLPVVAAYAVGAAALSPVPALEVLARRRVAVLVRSYLGVTGGLAAMLLWWACARAAPPLDAVAMVRDFVGLLGLSVVGAGRFGATVGWVLPCGAMFVAIFLRVGGVAFLPLDWPMRGSDESGPWLIAFGLLAAGMWATFTRWFHLRDAGE